MPASTNYGTGRPKTCTARVHLRPGTGKIQINMILAAALIEGATLFAVVVGMIVS